MASYQSFKSDILKEINNLRTNPSVFADRLEETLKSYRDNNSRMRYGAAPVMTREGTSALIETVEALRQIRPMCALTLIEGMSRAAQFHCNDTGPLGIVGHIGSKEYTLPDRLNMFGEWGDCIGETIDYGSVSGFESVCALLIDDGLPSRPHRGIVLNPRFKKIGVGVGKHSHYTTVGCCVYSGEFSEKDNMPEAEFPVGGIENHKELKDWMEDAIKLTCEVCTEEEGGRTIKRVKKYWEMSDGNIQIIEEVEDPAQED